MQAKCFSIRRAGLCSLLALLSFTLLVATAEAQLASPAMADRAPSTPHVLYGPLAGIQNFEEWDLVLLNRDIIPEDVTLTIHSSDGKAYPSTTISLSRKATQHVDVRTLLPAGAMEGNLGGIRLEYYGPPRAVAAQVTIRGFHGFGNLDVPLLEDREFKSATLEALWWEPISARSYLVLGNSSSETVHADLLFGSGARQHIDLPPFATQLERFLYGSEDASSEGRISSAQITHSGAPGALRAAGFSSSLSEQFFDTLRFVDTKLSTESALYANGLHLGDTSGHLLVKNVSEAPIAVSGKIYPLDRTRSIKPLSVGSKSLAAGESGELLLPAADQLDGAAARLESSGGAASMIAAFTSVESTHHMARSVPFADTRDYGALTGGYPWRIDGDYTSTVSVTNIGGSRAAIAGFIRPSGGSDYRIDTKYLEPGETSVFDIKQIRDQQIPDPKGVKLARNVTAGQFEWSSILGDGKERLIGRADITSLSLGVSSPPTYYQCNCPLSAISAFVTPGNPFVGVGGETSATTEVQYKDICDGDESDAAFAALSWIIQNPPVLSLTTKLSPSTMKGLAAGTSTFSTTFTGETWRFSPSNGCQSSYATYKPAGTGTVATVTFSGTPVVPQGKTAPITATVSPSSNVTPITLTLSTTSGSGSAVFLNTGVSTTTITTTTVLTIVGGQASSVPNNISLTATVAAESQQITIGSTTLTVATSSGALPVNFLQTGVTTLSGAALQFTYTWGSSSGSLSDISTCNVREFVTYPGYVQGQQLNYYWTSPPYVNTYSPNPTTGAPGPASGAGLTDIQSSVGFVKPYAANSVTSNQAYQFQCPYYQNNQWVQFAPQSGTIPITRTVQQVGNTWQYTITKSGSSATGTLP